MKNYLKIAVVTLPLFLGVSPSPAVAETQTSKSDDTFNFKIGKNVPELDVKTIKDGLVLIQKHLDDEYGGAIPLATQKNIRVRIEASGKGDKQEGGGSPAATSIGPLAPRLYFDVLHPDWNQDTTGRGWTTHSDAMLVAAHEYVHAWHANLSGNRFPYGGWINEGLAVFISYDAMIKAGKMSKSDVDRFVTDGARQSKETSSPLKDYWRDSVWPGHVGYVAINWLVAESPKGKLSLRLLATDIAAGMSTKAAFADAFDIELDEFYNQFELYRKIINANDIELAIKARPPLKNIHEAGGKSDVYEFDIAIDKNASFEVMALDKNNKPLWKSAKMGSKTNNFTAKIPRAKTKSAAKFCVALGKGWIVRDQTGKTFSVSCGDFGNLSLPGFGYELKVEKQ